MRLGELLIADGLVLPAHLERVLGVQARRGMRIGSLLVDAELVTADAVARALGRQRTTPAALERHLTGRDPSLTALVPPELARRHLLLPIARAKSGGIVIAMRDPRDAAVLAELGQLIAHPIVAAVACELVLRRHVERAYPTPVEDVEVNMDSGPMPVIAADAAPELELGDIELGAPTDILDPATVRAQPIHAAPDPFDPETIRVGSLVSLDDIGVSRDHRASDMPPGRRSGTIGSAPAPGAVAPAMATTLPPGSVQSVREPAGAKPRPTPLPPRPGLGGVPPPRLAATLARIASAPSREAVIAAVVDHARASLDALIVLAVRQGMAFGDAGFAPDQTLAAIEAVCLPLSLPSVLKTAVDTARPYAGRPPVGSSIQDRVLKLLGKPAGLVVAPIATGGRVVNLLVAACRTVDDADAASAELIAITAACGTAYARLRS